MIIGTGSQEDLLSEKIILELCKEAFSKKNLNNKRVLAIIPDNTRTAPIDTMFKIVFNLLKNRVKSLDFLIALGTHPALSEKMIYERVGITRKERQSLYADVKFYNHEWKNLDQLQYIGTIDECEVEEISHGLMRQNVDITINKLVFGYDVLLIIGPTFPHEVVGFSGGNKYLFPGIAGEKIIHMFHWLGALISNPYISGIKDNSVRQIVDKAASLLPMERVCMSLVVKEEGLAGLFIGIPEEAYSAAADLSKEIHIIYKNHSFNKVLTCAPAMYKDLWTGGKCIYKLESVVSDGGELIMYAPHITEVSVTHGKILENIGYHAMDYFIKNSTKFNNIPGALKAHSTHVKGIGSYDNGIEKPRINVVLASKIPNQLCKKINLGYRDPNSIHIDEWKNREDDGILFVSKAGEILYRLKEDPFIN